MLLWATDTFMVSDRQGEFEGGRMDVQSTDRHKADRDWLFPPRLPPAREERGRKSARPFFPSFPTIIEQDQRARKVKAGLDENHFHVVLMASPAYYSTVTQTY